VNPQARLVIPGAVLQQAIRALERSHADWLACTVERASRQSGEDWLTRGLARGRQLPDPALVVARTPVLPVAFASPTAVLYLRQGEPPRAYLLDSQGQRRPMGLLILAPGLPEVGALPERSYAAEERWSRIAGALGDYAWRRLCRLHYLIVGCGRNGSLIAHALARIGAHRMTLVDPDTTELCNLDGDGYLPDHITRPKADALAESLRAVNPTIEAQPLAYSVSDSRILPAVREADVLITAVDDDGARWAVAHLSVLYLKPMLDIGTGALHTESGEPLIGADIRWLVPGECCLLCTGGVANLQQVEVVRQGLYAEQQHRAQRHWRRERRGSLRSLNMIATGLALRMLEDYLAMRLPTSRWLRLVYQGATPQLHELGYGTPNRNCLCAHTGGGDKLLTQPLDSIRQISHSEPRVPNPVVR
jgi:hypothetical protein